MSANSMFAHLEKTITSEMESSGWEDGYANVYKGSYLSQMSEALKNLSHTEEKIMDLIEEIRREIRY